MATCCGAGSLDKDSGDGREVWTKTMSRNSKTDSVLVGTQGENRLDTRGRTQSSTDKQGRNSSLSSERVEVETASKHVEFRYEISDRGQEPPTIICTSGEESDSKKRKEKARMDHSQHEDEERVDNACQDWKSESTTFCQKLGEERKR